MPSFEIKLDTSELAGLVKNIETFTPKALKDIQFAQVNKLIGEVYILSQDRMLSGINLSKAYADRRMELNPAKDRENIKAEIVAKGGGAYMTALSHYSPEQLRKPVKNSKRSKGDSARGIPAGQKTAGVSVEVLLGVRTTLKTSRAFLHPTKKDSEGNPLIFKRVGGSTKTGRDQLARLLGPSVYQLFAFAIKAIDETTADTLQKRVADQLLAEVENA
jgi:hypothetical protein